MSNNTKNTLLFITGLILTACQTLNVPKAYQIPIREIKTDPYGRWITLTLLPAGNEITADTVSGELICMDFSALYILEKDSMVSRIPADSVATAQLSTHNNQAGNYGLYSILYCLPSFIGFIAYADEYPEFISLAFPVAIFGLLQVAMEGLFERNVLKYPQRNSLNDFKVFARFPLLDPEDIDFTQLTLKK